MDRVPPNSMEAERALLGAIILENDVLNHISIKADQFYRTGHQIIFRAMDMLEYDAKPIDIVTLREELQDSGELDKVGGGAYIASLTNEVPSISNAAHYAEKIKKLSSLRDLITSASDIVSQAYEHGADSDEITSKFIDVIDSSDPNMKGADSKEVMGATFARIQRIYEGTEPPPVKTGLIDFDNKVAMCKGDLIVIAGRPGMGKTSVAMNFAREVSKTEPVAIYTLEMDKEDIGQVFIAQETGISRQHIRQKRKITPAGFASMERTCVTHAKLKKYRVFDEPVTPAYIRKTAKLMKKREGLGLIIIDYLSLMEAGVRTQSREEAVAYISRSLKMLAKSLKVPVIALQQLNRQCEGRPDKKPNLSDLRESGAIEQDADIVILAYRPEKYWPMDEQGIDASEMNKRSKFAGTIQLLVEKQRAGENCVIKLGWDGPATNITCISDRY